MWRFYNTTIYRDYFNNNFPKDSNIFFRLQREERDQIGCTNHSQWITWAIQAQAGGLPRWCITCTCTWDTYTRESLDQSSRSFARFLVPGSRFLYPRMQNFQGNLLPSGTLCSADATRFWATMRFPNDCDSTIPIDINETLPYMSFIDYYNTFLLLLYVKHCISYIFPIKELRSRP